MPAGRPVQGTASRPSRQNRETEIEADRDRADLFTSDRMVVTVDRPRPSGSPRMQTQVDIGQYCYGSTPGAHIALSTPDGTDAARNERVVAGRSQSEGGHGVSGAGSALNRIPPFFSVGVTFASPDDEHYYGLGQNHEGFLDHRGHAVRCWADYLATAGPSFCVPFMVTNKGYG